MSLPIDSPRFPILKLPHLVQWEIIRQAEIVDVIALTYSSSKMRNLVIDSRIRNAEVQCGVGNKDGWVVEIDGKFTVKVKELDRRTRVVMLKFKNSRRQMTLLRTHKSVNTLNHLFLQHLIPVFRGVISFQTRFFVGKEDLTRHEIWKHRRTMTGLLLESTVKRKLSEDEIKFILDEVTITKSLHICPSADYGFRRLEGFTQETVIVNNPHWLTAPAIINSESRLIELNFQYKSFAMKWIPSLLKAWMSNENLQNLETFRLELMQSEEFDVDGLEEVLDGIEYEEVSYDSVLIESVDGRKGMVTMLTTEFWLTTGSHLE